MSFLIPTAQPNPSLLARLGRLLHWAALGFAALMLVPAYFAATQSAPAPVQPASARVSQADRPGAPVGGPWTDYAPRVTASPGRPWEDYAPESGSAGAPWANDPIIYPKGQGEYGFAAAPDSAPSIQQQGLPYWFWMIAAAAFALTGRTARYLFGGE